MSISTRPLSARNKGALASVEVVMPVTRINHAVLYVRDADITAAFLIDALEFEIASRFVPSGSPGPIVFLRSVGSPNDHDLGLFSLGEAAPSAAGKGQVGMYHLAWEVSTLRELVDIQGRLEAAGALVGSSNHGVSRSLYAVDPDGLEFEVLWAVPPELMDDGDDIAIAPLDLDADVERFGLDLQGRSTAHPATV